MTRAVDIKQLIAEEASTPADRRSLEQVANRLEESLSEEVPYRPEFKAQLRKQLMAQARQQLTPWYRRPAFMGSGLAVAAAAVVLAIGLNLYQKNPEAVLPQVDPGPAEVAEQPNPVPPTPNVSLVRSLPRDLRQVALADERLGAATPAFTGSAGTTQGLELKQLTARPNEEQFRAMAGRLAFRGESRRTDEGWSITEGDRSLTLTEDGQVGYTNPAEPAAAETVDAQGARTAAHRFLDQALLPIPGQPVVVAGEDSFQVIYTEQVDGRPVINGRTLIRVSGKGSVLEARAFVATGIKTYGNYTTVLTEAEALAAAQSRGGTFDRADLVWVRTPGEETVYLQPYWRAFGTDSQGEAIVRYVPALKLP
ncbi:MAG: hypothetical protein ACOY93_00635 [Bacillota bacterium]